MSPVAIEPIDEVAVAFGRGVALYRVTAGLNQRQLAERLRERGVTFDTAAISRIEKGKRSVRLSEAVAIAEALGSPLEALVSGGQDSPVTQFERASSRADQSLADFRRAFLRMVDEWSEVVSLLDRHPELLPLVRSPEVRSATDYLGYVASLRRQIETELLRTDDLDNGRYVVVRSARLRDNLAALAGTVIESAMIPETRRNGRGQAANSAE